LEAIGMICSPSFAGCSGLMVRRCQFGDREGQERRRGVDRGDHRDRHGELPVQLPSRFEIVLNVKTAKALGIEFPTTVTVRATDFVD
jgi:hypothetical protein